MDKRSTECLRVVENHVYPGMFVARMYYLSRVMLHDLFLILFMDIDFSVFTIF